MSNDDSNEDAITLEPLVEPVTLLSGYQINRSTLIDLHEKAAAKGSPGTDPFSPNLPLVPVPENGHVNDLQTLQENQADAQARQATLVSACNNCNGSALDTAKALAAYCNLFATPAFAAQVGIVPVLALPAMKRIIQLGTAADRVLEVLTTAAEDFERSGQYAASAVLFIQIARAEMQQNHVQGQSPSSSSGSDVLNRALRTALRLQSAHGTIPTAAVSSVALYELLAHIVWTSRDQITWPGLIEEVHILAKEDASLQLAPDCAAALCRVLINDPAAFAVCRSRPGYDRTELIASLNRLDLARGLDETKRELEALVSETVNSELAGMKADVAGAQAKIDSTAINLGTEVAQLRETVQTMPTQIGETVTAQVAAFGTAMTSLIETHINKLGKSLSVSLSTQLIATKKALENDLHKVDALVQATATTLREEARAELQDGINSLRDELHGELDENTAELREDLRAIEVKLTKQMENLESLRNNSRSRTYGTAGTNVDQAELESLREDVRIASSVAYDADCKLQKLSREIEKLKLQVAAQQRQKDQAPVHAQAPAGATKEESEAQRKTEDNETGSGPLRGLRRFLATPQGRALNVCAVVASLMSPAAPLTVIVGVASVGGLVAAKE